jgi:hypothetical protein
MTRTALRVALVAAALIVGADAAAAQTLVLQEQSERHLTKLSGYGGSETRVGFKNAAMYEIRWSERNDDPCYLDVNGIGIKGGETFESRRSFTGCEIRSNNLKTVTFVPPKPDYRFIKGIRVCTSSKKLKGIKVWPVRLDAKTGKLSDDGAPPVTARRTNCKDWQAERMCPPGQVATGLILQRHEWHDIIGVKLECSTVRMSNSMTRPK